MNRQKPRLKKRAVRTNFEPNCIIVLFRATCLSRRVSRLINDSRIENFIQTNDEWVGERVRGSDGEVRGEERREPCFGESRLGALHPRHNMAVAAWHPVRVLTHPVFLVSPRGLWPLARARKSREYKTTDSRNNLASSLTNHKDSRAREEVSLRKNSSRQEGTSVIRQGTAYLRARCMACVCVCVCIVRIRVRVLVSVCTVASVLRDACLHWRSIKRWRRVECFDVVCVHSCPLRDRPRFSPTPACYHPACVCTPSSTTLPLFYVCVCVYGCVPSVSCALSFSGSGHPAYPFRQAIFHEMSRRGGRW